MPAPTPELEFSRWIVWQDDGLIAVDKPAGVLSQGANAGAGVNLVDLARAHLGRSNVGVLHRVDRNVSGLVLIAKHAGAARVMTALFTRGGVTRRYRGVVRGSPPADSFAIEASLAKDPRTNRVRAATNEELARMSEPERAAYRPARTEVTVVSRFRAPLGPCAVLRLQPISGRSHQLRVHLAHLGLPLIGDPKYGVAAQGVNRPLLHCEQIEFLHPHTRKRVLLEAKLPWGEAALSRLRPSTIAATARRHAK